MFSSPTDEAAPEETDQLQEFAGGLKNFTKFCAFREVSSLSYGDQIGGCNIVSSIEFDKDAEYFAVAGVTKKIKVCIAVYMCMDAVDHLPWHCISCRVLLLLLSPPLSLLHTSPGV